MDTVYKVRRENLDLQKYEIKGPDYTLIDRPITISPDQSYAVRRYIPQNGVWTSKQGEKDRVRLMFTGDITCFGRQFDAAQTDSGFDFNYEFDLVRPVFSSADLVVGNLETMVFPNAPFRNEQLVSEQNYYCNAPLEFLDALRRAGFDVLTNANNHVLDTGAVGIGETIDYIEQFGMIQTGTFKREKKRYELIDVCGFRVAIAAFATEYNNKLSNLTDDGAQFLLNTYSQKLAAKIAADARKDGAEIVIACIHWGIEHKLHQSKPQEQIARKLIRAGFDCIIGSHPHVPQPFTILQEGDRQAPVFYSMGNFVSHNVCNMRARAFIACLDLTRKDGQPQIECSFIPVYTANELNGKPFGVVPIFYNAQMNRNLSIRKAIRKVLGVQLALNDDLTFPEVAESFSPAEKTSAPEDPDLSAITEFPVSFSKGRFTYDVYADHAVIVEYSTGAGSFSIPNEILGVPVTEIAPKVFAGDPSLGKVNLNSAMTSISPNLFRGCEVLEGFRLGASIEEIGAYAFADCPRLTAVVMRNHVKTIRTGAFRNCPSLKTVKLPPNVQSIADDAFESSPQAKIYCERGSYAEQYAQAHDIPYAYMKLR